MTKWEIIKQELDTDPLGRGYAGMTDKQAADDLNTSYRDGPADGNILVQYTLVEVHRVNTGLDVDRITIWSRMKLMAEANVGDDVFGQTPSNNATRIYTSAADTIMRLLDTDVTALITNINDTRYGLLLDALADADCMSQAQADEMKTLSQNKRTRGAELEVGNITEGDVAQARALP